MVHEDCAGALLGIDLPVLGERAADPRGIELDPGAHTFTVSAPGRADETFAMTLRAGERAARTVRLRELPAQVEVLVTPPDAQVYVNDALLGRGAPVDQRNRAIGVEA